MMCDFFKKGNSSTAKARRGNSFLLLFLTACMVKCWHSTAGGPRCSNMAVQGIEPTTMSLSVCVLSDKKSRAPLHYHILLLKKLRVLGVEGRVCLDGVFWCFCVCLFVFLMNIIHKSWVIEV